MSNHSLLQWVFLTQGLNPDLLNCREILYHFPGGSGGRESACSAEEARSCKDSDTTEQLSLSYAIEYYSAIKNNMPFAATWMQLEIFCEVDQEEEDKYYMMSFLRVIWNRYKWTYLWSRNSQKNREETCACQGKGVGEEMEWKVGFSRCKLLLIKWINNKIVLFSTENNIQYSMINQNGKEYKKECICMYNLLCYISIINQHCESNILQLKFL